MSMASIPLSKHRVEALSDGVFAVVVTLLVFEMKVPELPRRTPDAELLHALGGIAIPLFAFLVTFLLAGSFWMLHHSSFHFVTSVDRPLLWLNVGFLMFVSLLPFSTALLGRFRLHSSVSQAVYFANQFAIASMLWLQWRYAASRNRLRIDHREAAAAASLSQRIGTLAIAGLSGAVAAIVAPDFAFMAFIVPLALGRARDRRGAKRPAADVTIRRANHDDLDFAREVATRLAEFGPPSWVKSEQIADADFRSMRRSIETPADDSRVLIAEDGGRRRVGAMLLQVEPDYFSGVAHGHVGVLAVARAGEGTGVARALMNAAEEWAKEKGFSQLTLNVFDANRHARDVYEHLGYAPETTKYVKVLGFQDGV